MPEARQIPGDHPDALAILGAMEADIEARYGPIEQTVGAAPADLSPPDGAFVAIYEDGHVVAGGGVKRLAADCGEIKRMYVLPEHRGRGLGRLLLDGLEAAARDLGYARVRLDTGEHYAVAEALYRSAGYRPIDDYNGNVYASYWGEKEL